MVKSNRESELQAMYRQAVSMRSPALARAILVVLDSLRQHSNFSHHFVYAMPDGARCPNRVTSRKAAVATPAIQYGRHVMSTRTGISFLTAIVKSDGGSILKSDSVAGIVPDIRIWFP